MVLKATFPAKWDLSARSDPYMFKEHLLAAGAPNGQ
jgi:hypothetical protein